MSFVSEFKDFIMKGNVMDLAVAVIIGGAFQKIITSLVEDVITPVILSPAMKMVGVDDIAKYKIGDVSIGKFLAAVIGFLVIAFVIFMMVKAMNKAISKKEEAPAAPSSTDVLLGEIRDLLKK